MAYQSIFARFCSVDTAQMAFGGGAEEVVASDLVAGGFPADMGEGGVNLAIPLVSAIEYVYPRRQLTRMQHVYP